MEREWVKNSQPSKSEIMIFALIISAFIMAIPIIILLVLTAQGELRNFDGCCCTASVIGCVIVIGMAYSNVNMSYKAVTHVGFSADGIALRHRASDTVFLKWKNIEKIKAAPIPGETNLHYWHPVTCVQTIERIDTSIADMINVRMNPTQIPENRRFCPNCGRQNDGWEICPNCGSGWD